MQLLRRLSFTMLLMSLMTLVACGDGDGDLTGGSDGDGDTTDAVTLTVTKSDGDLSAANHITITATVLDNGSAVANKTVTFTFAVEGSATFDPVAGTATTDANGNASINVKVTDMKGSVSVIASYGSVSDDISFDSKGDGVKVIVGEPVAASISLFASSQQLASSGAQSIELFAIAKDENNNLLEGVTIQFSPDSGELGNILDESGDSSNKTGPDGKVTKKLSTQIDPSNRVIIVTVTSGDITDSLAIEVVGTTLTLTGSASLALNDEASFIVNVLDSDGNGVAQTVVAVSASNVDGITIPSSVTTDSEGQATVKVTGTTGGTNTIIVTALGTSASQDVSVQADSFLFTSFSNGVNTVNPANTPIVPDVSLIQTASLTLTWQRDGAPVANGTDVTFTTTRGVFTDISGTPITGDAKTETIDGKVTVYLKSTDAGQAIITFVGSDTVDGNAIELTNQLEFEFFADTAATINAQASPNSIGPDEQKSTISVVVKDADGNRVKNKRIQFVLEDISGGSIFPATAVTNSSGSASTIYTSNSTSAKDAVAITASVEDNSDIKDTVTLTVSDRELFISLGTGNQVEELGTTDYVKEYSIFVIDAESNAVENVELTVSAIPQSYYKGFWMPTYDGDDFVVWATAGAGSQSKPTILLATTKCGNEDANFNGILDGVGTDASEDFNKDGQLTPKNIVSVSGSFITDTDGRSVIRIIYPQSYAHWLDVKLVVSGKVTGSESATQTIFTLPVLAAHVTNEKISPPHQGLGHRGPFGLSNVCSDNVSQDPL
ncbi:hypothetical protein CMT41_04790 [Colwellia sp. MT41]|uniref:Big-1 domain-containing protein n=1 Tax=Colwellia marinimaniae TaxID=1513592 RepID=A0ABQ0MRG3_9GAMM|nr:MULTISPECIES: Ig-like domain-containing protein [Colwellia]ALO34121.1 hypothetical protein CMT41_04790 [Colwellia sp. MT41]GAW94777.1 hypothetical protein MTCD1_00374 [Colwellia marinimaniae]